MSIFRRLFRYFSTPEEEIVEPEHFIDNNKRCLSESYLAADSMPQNKRAKHTTDKIMEEDQVTVKDDRFQATCSSLKSNGTCAVKEYPNFSQHVRAERIQEYFSNVNRQQKIQLNIPHVHKKLRQNDQQILTKNMKPHKNSALDDISSLRDKIKYCTLIKSQTPEEIIFSRFKSTFQKADIVVDLTKNIDAEETQSIVNNNSRQKSILKLSQEGDSVNALKNITLRKKSPPTSEHTKWISDLNKKYEHNSFQRQLKIDDEKFHDRVLNKENKIFDDLLQERLERGLKIKEVIDLPEDTKVDVETVLPNFTPEEEMRINNAMKAPSGKQIIQKFNYTITGACLYSLSGLNWLNDNVINFYMKLLTQRGTESGKLKVYAMDSFFCVNLRTRGYSSVRRWTRKVDIFSFDLMPIPVHVNGVHWCMLIINFRDKTLKYYDSMGGSNKGVLNMVENYLKEESLDKKKIELDTSTWQKETVKNIPQQMNGCDCGVFSCMFAEYICRGAKITFSQKEMKYFRKKMCLEIINGKLLT